MHQELGIAPDEVPRKKKRLRAVDYGHKPSPVIEGQKSAPDAVSDGLPRAKVAGETDRHMRSPQRSISVEDEDFLDSDGASVDCDQYQSRPADSDSDSDSDSEDEAEGPDSDSWEGIDAISTQESQDKALPPKAVEATPPQYHPSHSLSPSPSPSPSPSLSPSPTPPYSTHPPKPPATTKQTTFLPSLIGGYFSGSDSAPSDTEPSAAQPRKNRRGQQERRAIWEKKFGRGAKHLQQEPQQRVQKRDEGWDARRGASDGRGRGRGRGGMRGGGRSRQQLASGANGEAVSGKRNVGRGGAMKGKRKGDEGPLHPSWEAKKKAKEKAAAGVGAVAFLGKKIVFD